MTKHTTDLVIELGVTKKADTQEQAEGETLLEVEDWLQSLEAHGHIDYFELHVDREV